MITSKSGLRQGDPPSPYLFVLVADVLQQLCISEFRRGNLKHPLAVDSCFPVLQYADDTLLLIQGNVEQARIVEGILELLSQYTGLQINFNKRTFVPICID